MKKQAKLNRHLESIQYEMKQKADKNKMDRSKKEDYLDKLDEKAF